MNYKEEYMKINLEEIKLDQRLLKLRPINLAVVSNYRQSYRAGNKFPMPIIEKGTNIAVSGNHRVSAMIEEYGEGQEIGVIVKEYENRAELLKEFAKENSAHGMQLAGYSKREITLELLGLGESQEEIASIFGVSVKKIVDWGGLTVVVRGAKGKKEYHAMKHGLEHMAGQEMGADKYEEHRIHDRGIPIWSQANQIIRWIKDGWIRVDDPKTKKALTELHAELKNLLSKEDVA